jgi:hypothetical protein
MYAATNHQLYDRLQPAPGDRADHSELDLAQGLMLGSVLGAFTWGVLAGIVWLCI